MLHVMLRVDAPTTDITESYAAASSFISRVEKVKGRVLVHCVSGMVVMHMPTVAVLMRISISCNV